ncbi:MAG: transposase, partial [Hydrogenophaga sp.]|nr:transposase [Hydrogenophaga sp.]
MAVEPKAGQRTVSVTERRGKADFVVFVGDLLTHTYAKARRVHLVLDNLNIHFRRCFDDVLGKRAANKLLRRVQFHYTPKHASWLNWRRSRSVSSVVNVWTGELKAETA